MNRNFPALRWSEAGKPDVRLAPEVITDFDLRVYRNFGNELDYLVSVRMPTAKEGGGIRVAVRRRRFFAAFTPSTGCDREPLTGIRNLWEFISWLNQRREAALSVNLAKGPAENYFATHKKKRAARQSD